MSEAKTAADWVPPVIYDVMHDNFRAVTQRDVDKLTNVQRAYGQLREAVASVHQNLKTSMEIES